MQLSRYYLKWSDFKFDAGIEPKYFKNEKLKKLK